MSDHRVTAVAHVLWSGNVGGIERFVLDLTDQQRKEELDVTVVFGRAEGPFAAQLESSGARVIDLGLGSGYDLRPSRLGPGVAALSAVEVIHLHGFNPAFAVLVGRAQRPVVFTEHGNFGLGREPGPRDRLKKRLQKIFLNRRVYSIAANSHHTADRLSARYGIKRSRVAVVHNGIPSDLDVVSPARANGTLRLAFLGRLVPFKRVDRAILGLGEAARRELMHLDVIGGGPLEADLKRLASSVGVADRVSFHGYRQDVGVVLSECDILIQPSQAEPFGLAILEACAHGVLPIAFADGGGALEALPPDGLVVNSEDELAATFDRLLDTPVLSSEARQRRAAWVQKHFSISATARSYRELYESAARRPR
jgi:glycosyltransferase involved in cell wall biosynthesis